MSVITFLYIYAFVFGACIASFINVVIYRLPLGIPISKGRSRCDSCGTQLKWYDLIPVISYVIYRGKCHYCGAKIGIRGWLLEIVGGLLGCLCFYHYGLSLMTIASFILAEILIAVTFIDIDTMEIPNQLVVATGIMAILFAFIDPTVSLVSRVIGFFIVSAPMLGLCYIKEGAFGGGDIKLIAALGLWLGSSQLLDVIVMGLIAGGIGAFLLMKFAHKKKTDTFAYGPFFTVAALLQLFVS
jgi:leader peptidase (prepilin peptidase)/N-methyltransferase